MKSCSLLLFAFLWILGSYSLPIQQTIGFQIHSWNDLREWPQAFKKGAQWLKIDPNYQDQSFCSTQVRVKNKTDARGCMILNHDVPNATSRKDFNTTDDVLDFISNPQYTSIFKSQKTIFIALCFKNIYAPCDGSLTSTRWMSLVDEFFEKANTVIQSNKLNVEFILDGSGTPGGTNRGCLDDKWRPWNATWISTSDVEKFDAAFSNDKKDGYDRFQVMNEEVIADMPTFDIDLMAFFDYGKFSKQSKYSYLNWEPDDQQIIQEVTNSYLKKGLAQDAGFRFAINMDPVQFVVYSSDLSEQGWNVELGQTSDQKHPFITAIPSKGALFVVTIATTPSTIMYSVYETSGTFAALDIVYTSPLPLFNFFSNIAAVSTVQDANGTAITLISDGSGKYALYSSNFPSDFELHPIFKGAFISTGKSYGSSLTSFNNQLFVSHIYSATNCALELQIYKLESFQPKVYGSAICIETKSISSASVSLQPNDHSNNKCKSQFVSVVSYSSASNNVYTSVICSDDSHHFNISGIIDVGSDTRISLVHLKNQLFVIEVHSDGYCWNNEDQNKRANIALCDSTPSSTPFVLNYNFGDLNSWISATQEGGYFSSCSQYVLHGMYDMGSTPSATLIVGSNQEIVALEVHSGISSDVQDVGDCGMPLPYDGLVIDGWTLL